jgi:hypothetical protein
MKNHIPKWMAYRGEKRVSRELGVFCDARGWYSSRKPFNLIQLVEAHGLAPYRLFRMRDKRLFSRLLYFRSAITYDTPTGLMSFPFGTEQDARGQFELATTPDFDPLVISVMNLQWFSRDATCLLFTPSVVSIQNQRRGTNTGMGVNSHTNTTWRSARTLHILKFAR